MDFGVLGFESGLVGGSESTTGFASDPQTKHKWYGSGSVSAINNNQDNRSVSKSDLDLRGCTSKLPRTDAADFSASRRSNASSVFSEGHQSQMLSFSSVPKSEPNLTFTGYNRNTGFNGGNMHGGGAAGRGPLTPSQWMELQHQALIYKYITENVPVPSNLLIPIRKAFDSVQLSAYSGGLLRPNTYGWGTFHLGFAGNNTDPEPGRCRRTDGKKWRCSRDAVADQKYCERHLNRGRHRSRKPVEGQFGHSAAAKAAAASTTTTTSLVAFGGSGGSGNASNSLSITQQQQLKNLQPGGSSNLTPATTLDRMFLSKQNVDESAASFSILSPTAMMKPGENCFMVSKQPLNFEETSKNQFGIVSSDALRNPSQKNSALMNCRSFGSSSSNHSNQETESQNPLRQFMDDWPKIQSNCSSVSWPEVDAQSETTQLSIAIPMAASDFMSSTSSPNNEKATVLSPLRLSREFNPIKMRLGVGNSMSESDQRQANWIPVSWESCMGGPLGEVLHSTNNSIAGSKNSSSLNLMTEGWDGSPRVVSSPTGVLQKASFNSLSNSSTGSSPRAENSGTLCNDLLGSTVVRSLPAS